MLTSPMSPVSPLSLLRSAIELLTDAGYLEDVERLLAGDPDLLEQIQDPDFLSWLQIGAPGGGSSSEAVILTSKGASYEAS